MNYTADQLALQDYITAENAKSQAWMDEAPGRAAGMFPGVDHWISDGINTVEQFRHYMAVESYINVYKSFNNIKPRWALAEMKDMTADDVEAKTDKLYAQADEEAALNDKLNAIDANEAKDRAAALGVSLADYKRWQEDEYKDDRHDTGWC